MKTVKNRQRMRIKMRMSRAHTHTQRERERERAEEAGISLEATILLMITGIFDFSILIRIHSRDAPIV